MKSNSSNFWLYFFYCIAAFIAFWYWHVDEHYQIFEYASYKLGYTLSSELAWEFHSKIRSAILPLVAFIVSKSLLITPFFNPFLVESICRVLGALLFVYILLKLSKIIKHEFQIEDTNYDKWVMLFWILPIVMVRFSSESISSSLYWLGFIYLYPITKNRYWKRYLIVGIIWGLAFYIRIHIAILIGVFILWDLIIKKQKLSYYFPFGIGFLISTCIEIASNYWLYGDLIWSPYGYFYSNVIDGAANSFGIQPVYFYFSELIKNLIYPIGFFVITGLVAFSFSYKKSIFSWFVWIFIAVHSIVSHKEYRFLFPIFVLLAPLSYLGLYTIDISSKLKNKLFTLILYLNLILLPSCLLIHSFKPYNFLRLYPYTAKEKKIASLKHNLYSLDPGGRFDKVKTNFWKHPKCEIVVLKDISNIDSSFNYVVSIGDYGKSFRINDRNYEKVFETIPLHIKKKIPHSILLTIDQIYLYAQKLPEKSTVKK